MLCLSETNHVAHTLPGRDSVVEETGLSPSLPAVRTTENSIIKEKPKLAVNPGAGEWLQKLHLISSVPKFCLYY